MTDVTVQNDITYLFLQWIGWDYNFINVIIGDILLIAITIGIIFLIGFIGMILGIIK